MVGVISTLALWFGLHVMFSQIEIRAFAGMRLLVPQWSSLDVVAGALAVVAALALFRFRLGVIRTLGLTASLGVLVSYLA